MSVFSVQIFATDLMAVYAHYKRAFGAAILFDGKADDGTLIHLQLDIMGASIGGRAWRGFAKIAVERVGRICDGQVRCDVVHRVIKDEKRWIPYGH